MKNFEKICLLGQRIDVVDLNQVLLDINTMILKKKKSLYFAMNINILLALSKERLLKRKHSQSRCIYADGMPLVFLSKFLKVALPARVSGTDLVEQLLKNNANKIFIVGGSEYTQSKISQEFSTVVGGYIPPFGDDWNEKVDRNILKAIEKSQAEILLIAVGALKQEKWLWKYFDQTPCYVGLGVGSALEILSGEKKRAPKWMQVFGFEWLWRIILEPRRLTQRYVRDAFNFLQLLLQELVKNIK